VVAKVTVAVVAWWQHCCKTSSLQCVMQNRSGQKTKQKSTRGSGGGKGDSGGGGVAATLPCNIITAALDGSGSKKEKVNN